MPAEKNMTLRVVVPIIVTIAAVAVGIAFFINATGQGPGASSNKPADAQPAATVIVAPAWTVKSRHAAVAFKVDGALGVPAGMMTSVDARGGPGVQLAGLLQSLLTVPFQVD